MFELMFFLLFGWAGVENQQKTPRSSGIKICLSVDQDGTWKYSCPVDRTQPKSGY